MGVPVGIICEVRVRFSQVGFFPFPVEKKRFYPIKTNPLDHVPFHSLEAYPIIPYIGLVYGRYLQFRMFRYLKWPLIIPGEKNGKPESR